MCETRRSFVEAGGASNVVALLDAGVPLVDSQADLTPFQREVLLQELTRQQEAAQEDTGSQPPGQVNQLRQPRGGGGETVTYINEHTEPDPDA